MELVNQPQGLKKKIGIFKKNMENAVESVRGVVIFALAISFASFMLCRTVFMGSFLPCGAALATALMYKNRLNVYLLPVMALSMFTCFFDGYYVIGDMAATFLCGVTFVVMGRRRWGIFARSVIAASITVTANCAYYMGAGMLYRLDLAKLGFEALLVVVLSHVFYFFLKIWFAGDKPAGMDMENIIAVTVLVCMLILCSSGLGNVFNTVSISMIGGMFLILLLGYKFGVFTGIAVSGIVGVVMALCGNATPGVIPALLCGGIAAGFFKGQNRFFAMISFAGACLAPGLLGGYSELAVPCYAPLAASALMLPAGKRWLDRLNPLEDALGDEKVQREIRIKNRIEDTLNTYLKHFEFLAGLYGGRKDGRSAMGYQFSGMTHVVKSMLAEVGNFAGTSDADAMKSRKYSIEQGEASYAMEGSVSGDSYVCRKLNDDRYVMILSDGMGKGEAAAVESNLAVNTLMKLMEVGFDAETAIKAVNSILILNSGQEIFSTIDMGLFDLNSGKLKLFKVGAAPTFIKRGDKVSSVKMAALPIGIVDGLSVSYINVRLRPGDQVIMVSDGILDSCREDVAAGWLTGSIESIKSKDPQTMADLIINRAVENYGIKEKDDLTVLAFRIQ